MTDQLISFETAKLAKEKGFRERVRFHYYNNSIKPFIEDNLKADFPASPTGMWDANMHGKTDLIHTSAPTQSLLQKWLREVHNIHMFVSITTNDIFLCRILNPLFKNGSEGRFIICKICNTYEEALEQGLIEALKLIQ